MKIVEPLTFIRGELRLIITDNGDGILTRYEYHKNLVLNVGKHLAARAIAGELDPITRLAVGAGTIAPHLDDTAIPNAVVLPLVNYTVEANAATFNFNIGYFDANGLDGMMPITEFGLLTQSGALFSRVTRAVIEKTNHIAIRGSWTISFT
jgi:hypothetical protein